MFKMIDGIYVLFLVGQNGQLTLGIILAIALILLVLFVIKKRKIEGTAESKDESEKINSNKNVIRNTEAQNVDNKILIEDNIVLGLKNTTKEEAIKMAGQLLVNSGYVGDEYIQAMLERENVISTYIGNGVAIPHGVGSAKEQIIKSGIVVLQFPQGVDFGENIAYLIIGIAGKDNDHLKLLSNIATTLENNDVVEELIKTTNAGDIYNTFTKNL